MIQAALEGREATKNLTGKRTVKTFQEHTPRRQTRRRETTGENTGGDCLLRQKARTGDLATPTLNRLLGFGGCRGGIDGKGHHEQPSNELLQNKGIGGDKKGDRGRKSGRGIGGKGETF